MKKRLFLVCPDAHLEPVIPGHFSGEAFFLTALGVAFNPMETSYDLFIDHFIEDNGISEICLVADTSSRFFRNVVQGKKGFDTYAEKVLEQLLSKHSTQFEQTRGAWQKCLLLTRLHLAQQLQQLEKSRYLGRRIEQGKLVIKAYQYLRNTDRMEEIKHSQELYAPYSRVLQGAEALYGQTAAAATILTPLRSAPENTAVPPAAIPSASLAAEDFQTSPDAPQRSLPSPLTKIRAYLVPGLALSALIAAVLISATTGGLLMKELLVSTSIIAMLLAIRQIKPDRS